jgi:hypothetical protein
VEEASSRADTGASPLPRWEAAQRAARDRAWPDVERLLAQLPPRLAAQAKLLEYDLALRTATSGQLRDAFLGADAFPLTSIPSWLLADLAVPIDDRRDAIERRLYVAAVLLALAAQALDEVGDEGSFADGSRAVAAGALAELALAEATRLVEFGLDARSLVGASIDGAEAWLRARDTVELETTADPGAWLVPRWGSAAEVVARAACATAGRNDLAPGVVALLDDLAVADQLLVDLEGIHRDLMRHRPTYPILLACRSAGLPTDPWPEPVVGLGAVAVTGTAGVVMARVRERLDEARRRADELTLPTFAGYVEAARGRFEARLANGGGSDAAAPTDGGRPILRLVEPTLAMALTMAERFLLADPLLRESWETHREGMFGAPEVAARFPAGLVLEVLGRHGHAVGDRVEAFLAFAVENGFRYYDHPWSDADADSVGICARLAAGVRNAEAVGRPRPELSAVLDCVAADVDRTGRIGVWLAPCPGVSGALEPRPRVTALGDHCATVAAHLLLGLVAFDPSRYGSTIGRAGTELARRVAASGIGANVDYPPLYALAILGRTIRTLPPFTEPAVAPILSAARATLDADLDRAAGSAHTTPQAAALFALACLELDRRDLADPGWIAAVLRRQRFDGGWNGEPFAAAPNRGDAVTWYASATLTSALCYDALARWTGRPAAPVEG